MKTKRQQKQALKRYLANCDKWTIGTELAGNENRLNLAGNRTTLDGRTIKPTTNSPLRQYSAEWRKERDKRAKSDFVEKSKVYGIYHPVEVLLWDTELGDFVAATSLFNPTPYKLSEGYAFQRKGE